MAKKVVFEYIEISRITNEDIRRWDIYDPLYTVNCNFNMLLNFLSSFCCKSNNCILTAISQMLVLVYDVMDIDSAGGIWVADRERVVAVHNRATNF